MEHGSNKLVKRDPRRRAHPSARSSNESRTAERLLQFKRIRTPRAFEEIAEQIRKQLSDRRLRAGDRLPPERALAAQFGVSRNTLREALRSLENSGLLRLQKGATGGAFVRESTGDAIVTGLRDMFHLGAIQPGQLTEARVAIESIAVRMACERATAEDIDALNANIAAAERAARDKIDFYDQAATHLDFHRILARATKNPVMEIVMEALLDVMLHFIRAIGQQRNPWVLPSRRRFMKHFAAGESDAAVAEMEQHLERLNRFYLALVKEHDWGEDADGA
ncbi:MAG TPA: FadR/GntR family transcriptional regulator [Candidatus Binataceae bacterium]|nr:FadR/GntR family transcriptional regulator [Candidatus Binataceae bacterium]